MAATLGPPTGDTYNLMISYTFPTSISYRRLATTGFPGDLVTLTVIFHGIGRSRTLSKYCTYTTKFGSIYDQLKPFIIMTSY